jgi:hypothetical protein
MQERNNNVHTEPLLGNDREISTYTTTVAK